MSNRYEIRTGKWGSYFHDTKHGTDMNLMCVAIQLNLGDDYHSRLVEYEERRGYPVALAKHEQDRLDAIDRDNAALDEAGARYETHET